MRNVRVDTKGELRCWNCGCTSFREKRTLRSKMLVGVGALLTKKKLKCRICEKYGWERAGILARYDAAS